MTTFNHPPTFGSLFNTNGAANFSAGFPLPSAFQAPSPPNRPMKRHLNEVAEVEPSEKRPHYEKRISDSFDGIQLGGDSSSNSPLVPDPPAEEELDIDFSEIPDFDDESPGEEPVVEEPEESGGVELSSELRDYLQRQKHVPFLPQQSKTGQELVLFNRADEIKSRITEVTDDDLDLENEDENPDVCFASSTSSSSSSPRISPPPDDPNEPTEEEEMEVDEQMDVD